MWLSFQSNFRLYGGISISNWGQPTISYIWGRGSWFASAWRFVLSQSDFKCGQRRTTPESVWPPWRPSCRSPSDSLLEDFMGSQASLLSQVCMVLGVNSTHSWTAIRGCSQIPNVGDLRFLSGYRLCFRLKMLVKAILFLKTTILWALIWCKTLHCLLLFYLYSVFFLVLGVTLQLQKLEKGSGLLFPCKWLFHMLLCLKPNTMAGCRCEYSFLVQTVVSFASSLYITDVWPFPFVFSHQGMFHDYCHPNKNNTFNECVWCAGRALCYRFYRFYPTCSSRQPLRRSSS